MSDTHQLPTEQGQTGPRHTAKQPLTDEQVQSLLQMAAMDSKGAMHTTHYKPIAVMAGIVVVLVAVSYIMMRYAASHY